MAENSEVNKKRCEAVRSLISFSEPIESLSSKLAEFEWDYKDSPVVLSSIDVMNVLKNFLDDKISASDVEGWANLVECREDIDYESHSKAWIDHVITQLANPNITHQIDIIHVKALIANYDKNKKGKLQ